jgi:uncharacterized protein (TIGR02996 family)
MADEGGFLNAILTNPADDLTRLVYADWLDEQETDEATRKAEFLRLTANWAEKRKKRRLRNEKRLQEIACYLPTSWLPIVSRLMIENCEPAGNSIRQPLRTIEFECPKQWEQLKPTDDVSVRYCDACRKNVYYSESIDDAKRNAAQGRCVAVCISLSRSRWDLLPQGRPTILELLPTRLALLRQHGQWIDAPTEEGE